MTRHDRGRGALSVAVAVRPSIVTRDALVIIIIIMLWRAISIQKSPKFTHLRRKKSPGTKS
jgi:hypothetical protein